MSTLISQAVKIKSGKRKLVANLKLDEEELSVLCGEDGVGIGEGGGGDWEGDVEGEALHPLRAPQQHHAHRAYLAVSGLGLGRRSRTRLR